MIKVRNLTFDQPRGSLPQWVRDEAAKRGYGDSTEPLSLYIQTDDIAKAFACAAHGDGSACVMAQAGRRIGARSVYFYRTTAWVDFEDGPIVRFHVPKQVHSDVIEPFDRGDRQNVLPGLYHLMPPPASQSLQGRRDWNKINRERMKAKGRGRNDGSRKLRAHYDRVVMAHATK